MSCLSKYKHYNNLIHVRQISDAAKVARSPEIQCNCHNPEPIDVSMCPELSSSAKHRKLLGRNLVSSSWFSLYFYYSNYFYSFSSYISWAHLFVLILVSRLHIMLTIQLELAISFGTWQKAFLYYRSFYLEFDDNHRYFHNQVRIFSLTQMQATWARGFVVGRSPKKGLEDHVSAHVLMCSLASNKPNLHDKINLFLSIPPANVNHD